MQAMVLNSFGGPEHLQLEDVDMPMPGSGEALVRIKAAGVNPVDYKIRNGSMKLFTGSKFPRILGMDIAGRVERADDSSGFKPGNKVFAMLPFSGGGYAEFATVKSKLLCRMPEGLPFAAAAATPLAGLTAYQALCKGKALKEGDQVLINGASGGVGSFAVQVAKAMGAHVTAVTSTRNMEFVRSLGADMVIDYTKEDFTRTGHTYHKVFDAVAKSSFRRCKRILKRGGNYVTTVPDTRLFFQLAFNVFRTKKAGFIMVKPSGAHLRVLADMITNGQLQPYVETTFQLKEAGKAHQVVETERVRGKVVLIPG